MHFIQKIIIFSDTFFFAGISRNLNSLRPSLIPFFAAIPSFSRDSPSAPFFLFFGPFYLQVTEVPTISAVVIDLIKLTFLARFFSGRLLVDSFRKSPVRALGFALPLDCVFPSELLAACEFWHPLLCRNHSAVSIWCWLLDSPDCIWY